MDKKDRYISHIQDFYQCTMPVANIDFHFEGLCNDIAIVDETDVFRFPKEKWAVPLMEKEIDVLSVLRRNHVPHVMECRTKQENFAVFNYIGGKDLTHMLLNRLTKETVADIAKDLGVVLYQMHSITDVNHQSGAAQSVDHFAALYHKVLEQQASLTSTALDYTESVFQPLLSGELSLDYLPVLIHGDLAPYHIKVDEKAGHLSGLIDFGEAGLGDPATDIACLIYNLGMGFVELMQQTYPMDEQLVQRAKFYAKAIEFQWFVAAVKTNNPIWYAAHLGSYRG